MLRPYTYAYVSFAIAGRVEVSADRIAVYECRYRYPLHCQHRPWSLAVKDWLETHRQRHQADHRVCLLSFLSLFGDKS
jgi:hypothetical protein